MDPSTHGIHQAEGWLEAEGLRADLQVASPGWIPAADASFEAALSPYAIEHGSREEVFESILEIRRILKRGGLGLVAFSSSEDSRRESGRSVAPGTYEPIEGPETGIPHNLADRSDVDSFFASVQLLYLSHVWSRLSLFEAGARVGAHWAIIFRNQ